MAAPGDWKRWILSHTHTHVCASSPHPLSGIVPSSQVWSLPFLVRSLHNLQHKRMSFHKNTILMDFLFVCFSLFSKDLKMYNSVVSSIATSCAAITSINFRMFSSLQRCDIHQQSLPISTQPPSPRQPYYFLSLQISLFWTFHRNGIIQQVVLCDWFLPLSIFSRFIPVAISIRTFLFTAK